MGKDKKSDPPSHKLPPTTAVLRYMQRYGGRRAERPGRAKERILTWAARIHDGIAQKLDEEATPEELLADMLATDLRLVTFYLEGILKLYKRSYPMLEDGFLAIKDLEDRLGDMSAARGFAQLAIDHNAPDPLVKHLQLQCEGEARALREALHARWLPNQQGRIPALAQMTAAVLACPFEKYKQDRKLLKKELHRRMEKFAAIELDMHQLQGEVGLHELRRQLRWFPIYAVALDGLCRLVDDKNPISQYEPLLRSELAESKYSKLPSSNRESKTIDLSRSLFVANNGFISRLGEIKDRGEEIEAMEHGFIAIGYPKPRVAALALLGKTQADFDAVHAEAGELHAELLEVGFAKALAKSLA